MENSEFEDMGVGALPHNLLMISSLNKSNSILSLTLDEIQCKSGNNFGGMTMDQLLANICNVEQTQNHFHQQTNIPIPLSAKTVDQVWSEIHKHQPHHNFINNLHQNPGQSQPPLGEMTLEDFLVKAGVVQESSSLDFGGSEMGGKVGISLPFHQQNAATNMSGNCFSTYQMLPQSSLGEPSNSTSIQKCQSFTHWDDHTSSEKRIIDGPPEVVVQRRQRRMIKNRESAARSRARKQAYTVELEVELNQLKEENVKLKQIVAESERRRKQEMKQRKQSQKRQKPTERLRTMRRIASMAW